MEKMFEDFINCKRFSRFGKLEFVKKVKEWSKNNLDNFAFETQRTFLLFDITELLNILVLFCHSVLLIYLIFQLNVFSFIFEAIIFIIVFVIQYRLFLLVLPMVYPSRNIILHKKCSYIPDHEVIVCAHYDTKNSLMVREKNFFEKNIKHNIFGISRLLGKYLFYFQKHVNYFVFVGYLLLLFGISNSTEPTFFSIDYLNIWFSIASSLGYSLAINTLFCIIAITILTFPLRRQIINWGADDNTSGVVGALEIGKQLNKEDLDCDVKIVLFDNEEKGLIGSNHYAIRNIKSNKKDKLYVINLDCIGRGEEIHLLTDYTKNNTTYDLITNQFCNNKIQFKYSNIDYSDHKPFLNMGVNAVSIGRYNCERYLWEKEFPVIDWIHGSEDKFENIDISKVQQIVDIIVDAVKNIKK